MEVEFAWGLGIVDNNKVEAIVVYQGTNIMKDKSIVNTTFMGDSSKSLELSQPKTYQETSGGQG